MIYRIKGEGGSVNLNLIRGIGPPSVTFRKKIGFTWKVDFVIVIKGSGKGLRTLSAAL